jgi:protocatechuate 3,4-dioxygenase beta subunit
MRDLHTRRSVLTKISALIGVGGAALLIGRVNAAPARTGAGPCVVRPRHIEGPYFVDTTLNRSDIRSDPRSGEVKYGIPLRLTFRVSHMNDKRCLPLRGARVDVWHCDAEGRYSDTKDWQDSTVGRRFLRGFQLTDRRGLASFTTIFPGWYPNRAVHVHFKIRTGPADERGNEFTSQIYFDDALTDAIHAQPPYAQRGARKVRNDRDLLFLFRGSRLVLPLREDNKGYAGTFDIALDSS